MRVNRANYFKLAQALDMPEIPDFSIYPAHNVFHRFLLYLKEPCIADRVDFCDSLLLFLLWMAQNVNLPDEQWGMLASGFSDAELTQPDFDLIRVEHAGKDLQKYTRGKKILLVFSEENGSFDIDIDGIASSTNKPVEMVIKSTRLTDNGLQEKLASLSKLHVIGSQRNCSLKNVHWYSSDSSQPVMICPQIFTAFLCYDSLPSYLIPWLHTYYEKLVQVYGWANVFAHSARDSIKLSQGVNCELELGKTLIQIDTENPNELSAQLKKMGFEMPDSSSIDCPEKYMEHLVALKQSIPELELSFHKIDVLFNLL
jgi:hypothetical protein